jgi:multidrug efflux pump subunit AcrA (membrane-fusion protein)
MFKLLPRVLTYSVIAIIVAVIIRMAFSGRPQVTVGTTRETTTVGTGDINITVNATGNINANQEVSLSFGASGKVTQILVQPGEYVRKGQLIATVQDQSALDAVASAQASVYSRQLALKQLTAPPRDVDMAVAQASLAVAQARVKESNVGVSPIQIQIAKDNIEIAKNQLWQNQLSGDITNQNRENLASNPRTSAQAGSLPSEAQVNASNQNSEYGVQIAQLGLDATLGQAGSGYSGMVSAQGSELQAQINLNNLTNGADPNDIKQAQNNIDAAEAQLAAAEANLNKTRLVAPMDGLVAQINLQVGQTAPTSAAVVMLDTSKFYVDVPVSEIDIASIKVGQKVDLHFDALSGKTLSGTVTRISDTATQTNPVTYTVRVELDPTDQPLLASMSTTANIITSQASNVVRISNRFIRVTGNRAFASLQQPDGSFADVPITLGAANDLYTEIKSGLKVGDVIAIPQQTTTSFGAVGAGAPPAGGFAGGPPGG